ncbi:VCBS repeat-containing protein [Streptomyces sp. NBC_00083]|uniref:FG-GAP repeat domain-containing protein n=1 Tax=Streptomyces sp. NBC_00083 TaxID=2975647 RepID=UPI00224E7940|nr:VCBS repeat-containing protein [Streptomyces sp. NBC_00083]MCX5386291.1 VCBS repeat-containing protein [Streptomyces sp. NBC_00083]
MANLKGRKSRKALSRFGVVAIAAALVASGAGVASADGVSPARSLPKAPAHSAPHARSLAAAPTPNRGANPVFPMLGVDNAGDGWAYGPNGTGGLTSRVYAASLPYLVNDAFVDNNGDGDMDGEWQWANDGSLNYFADENAPNKVIGGGWGIYDKELSPGNLGGGGAYDIIARDKAGVLWIYLGYGDGTVTGRVKVGAGWDAYTQIAGKGDLDGDGKADIVARDTAGVLWFYKGTGNYAAPFAPRTKIGAGWNMFNTLVSTGDVDLDGKTDLIARDTNGGLWLYKGTGNAAAPYQARVQIGSNYNIYRLLTS